MLLAMTLPSCSTVRAACGGVVGGRIGGAQDGVELALRVHHRRRGSGDEAGLRLAQRVILLLVQGGGLEPFARRRAEALDHVVDVLDGLAQRRDHCLVGAELDDLAELLQRDAPGSPSSSWSARSALLRCARPAAPVPGSQGSRFVPRAAGWRPDAECPVRSDRPWSRRDVPAPCAAPALITIAMPAITAKAANRLPLTPHLRKADALKPEFADAKSYCHVRCPALLPLDDSSRGSIVVPG